MGANQSVRIRVLVVDDFAPWRESVCSVLQKEARLQVVGEASDGREAVEKAGELKPDIILLDIGLPRLNGIDAAKQLHRVLPGARILFVTGIEDADVLRAALRNGARGYVLKADAGSELSLAIVALQEGRRYVNRSVAGQTEGPKTERLPWD
jgi:DNA-binding NarL/FixJ family response regulator